MKSFVASQNAYLDNTYKLLNISLDLKEYINKSADIHCICAFPISTTDFPYMVRLYIEWT